MSSIEISYYLIPQTFKTGGVNYKYYWVPREEELV